MENEKGQPKGSELADANRAVTPAGRLIEDRLRDERASSRRYIRLACSRAPGNVGLSFVNDQESLAGKKDQSNPVETAWN